MSWLLASHHFFVYKGHFHIWVKMRQGLVELMLALRAAWGLLCMFGAVDMHAH
jgi:hypothetical protein